MNNFRSTFARFWVAAALTLLVAPVVATGQALQVRTETFVRGAELGKAQLSLLITDLDTGDDIVEINPDAALMPASNMKLITTAAALATLGPDFNFSTQLRIAGDTLIIRGDGDPGFGDPVLLDAMGLDVEQLVNRWVEAVHRTGKTRFDAIIVDDRVFDQQFVHPDWPENQLHKWYCAQVAGIAFNDNCLDLYARPTNLGKTPEITLVPADPPIDMDNLSTTGKDNAFWASRKLGGNKIILRGTVKHALVEPINVTIHDPPIFFGELLQRRLRAAGISVKDVTRVEPNHELPDGSLLAEVQSTLPTVIGRCNRDSQNLFAESLLKRLGRQITGQPGSWANGSAAVRLFLTRVVGTEAASTVIADGSGMSRNNRVSARTFVRTLAWMNRQKTMGDIYLNSLAEPGEGTLEKRFTSVKLTGELHAKTGYIRSVVCLSGYLIHDGHTIAFSMLLNDYYKGTAVPKTMMEKIIGAVDEKYAKDAKVQLGG
ncbi:MAG: D-alanyl-D-alanine carboxypeptidase/D-alanyl-D-alanine-endopeptidase [Planctomycetes bacterium]|nr:D-alanyl-D-alanine carboxypeptidase/D-alanyl-D-alanine-endopeptidase [Planctomycetota bacterium]